LKADAASDLPVDHKAAPAVSESPDAGGAGGALCRSCGICCDGTLFTSVSLCDTDVVPALVAAGIKIVVRGPERSFEQPCAAHGGQACRVYANRPSICRTSRCKVLVELESHAIDWQHARERIRQVFALKEAVREELQRIDPDLAGASLTELRKRWTSVDDATTSLALRRKYGPALVCMVAFEWYLERYFFRESAAGDPACAFSKKRGDALAPQTASE